MDKSPPRKRAKMIKIARQSSETTAAGKTTKGGECTFVWPMDRLPVEIFHLIASYLPRRDVQNMRQVSHEFDDKLSGWFLRNVVARFHPDMYGYLESESDGNDGDDSDGSHGVVKGTPRKDRSVIKNGEKVFEKFGHCIKAFAISLELNEADLASPPVKLSQKVVRASWGLYRWPLENYARYSDLEDLESTADETMRMTQAFANLGSLRELGLCCDAGLGFLTGLDARQTLPRVFKSSRYEPQTVGDRYGAEKVVAVTKPGRYMTLKRMVMNAGYAEEEAHDAIKLLLECEGKHINWVEVPGSANDYYDPDEEDLDAILLARAALTQSASEQGAAPGAAPASPQLLPVPPLLPPNNYRTWRSAALGEVQNDAPKPHRRALEPRYLTLSQREMLLEMKWAHEALIQSYVISVVDNYDIFSKVSVFSVARIPSSLIHILAREDLWGTLSSLTEFHLGVIPDWRRVSKRYDSCIDETFVNPVEACGPVFRLLNDFIRHVPNLKLFSFEWACGGETGQGLAQRNRYILPAPFAASATAMVAPDAARQYRQQQRDEAGAAPRLLVLPHIQKLVLRNCWFTPHVFLRVMKDMVDSSLTELELDSVSLTGPPTRQVQEPITSRASDVAHWPWPLCNGATPDRMFVHQPAVPGGAFGGGVNVNAIDNPWPLPHPPPIQVLGFAVGGPASPDIIGGPPAADPQLAGDNNGAAGPAATPSSASLWNGPLAARLPIPRLFTWAHIINELTPYKPILEMYHSPTSQYDDAVLKFSVLSRSTKAWIGDDLPTVSAPSSSEEAAEATAAGTGNNTAGGEKKKLKRLRSKSCGYLLVDTPTVDSLSILPTQEMHVQMASDVINKLRELDKSVLTAADPLLGKIVDHMHQTERDMLYFAFGLGMPGFRTAFDSGLVAREMREDGFVMYGRGRFSGTMNGDGRSTRPDFVEEAETGVTGDW